MTSLVERHFTGRGRGLEFEMEVDWVREHIPARCGRVIDVGCGIGALLRAIDSPHAIGLDHSADGLARTRARLPSAVLVCADAAVLPFAHQSLGAIAAQHVIEHIPACQATCREWFRVLQPGGVLLVLTPNGLFCDPSVYDDDTHVQVFDAGSLNQLLAGAGFEIIDTSSLGLPWFRRIQGLPVGWRLRRSVIGHAQMLSARRAWRWKGQTLCCVARRPEK